MLNFMGIGAQKSGTTWIYKHLKDHPEVGFPGGKELHFWDDASPRSWDQYRDFFSTDDAKLLGEITPSYALLPPARIRQIKKYFPELRVFFVIRNPLERAWSSALMACHRAEMTPEEASDRWFMDHFLSAGSRARGDYLTTIRKWKRVFGADQFLLAFHDQIVSSPTEFLSSLCRFIGADTHPIHQIPESRLRHKVKPVPTGDHPIRESLRPILEDIYHPELRQLQSALGLNLDQWMN